MKTIALITDFGLNDIYVGVMKGIMHSICPEANFIDISHSIAPQSVREGALALLHSYHYFAPGTIFLVIVDPGVGSTRRPIAVKTQEYTFIAPDNGILSYALAELEQIDEAVTLENRAYHLSRVSDTFHGRDVFAPVTAHIARGVPLTDFGAPVNDLFMLPRPQFHMKERYLRGEVVHVDHFGNIITSIGRLKRVDAHRVLLEPLFSVDQVMIPVDHVTIKVHSDIVYGISRAYYEGARGSLMAQIDSNGYLEIAVNQGSAAARLDAIIGDIVELEWQEEEDETA